ncbi:hypothetical protein [Salipiger sp.]|uniref:hypothetical protein n=1 Tax=Salipiger sp. TaxID=2078585 RepID=UPI003A9773D2
MSGDPDLSAACRALWAAVLERAWSDSFGARSYSSWKGTETLAVEQARQWMGSDDFATVCLLAGLDPAAVYGRWRRAIQERSNAHGRKVVRTAAAPRARAG